MESHSLPIAHSPRSIWILDLVVIISGPQGLADSIGTCRHRYFFASFVLDTAGITEIDKQLTAMNRV